MERITGMQSGRRTCYGRVHRQFKVYWKRYGDPSWVDEVDLNCSALIQEWDSYRVQKNRFVVIEPKKEGDEKR